MKVIRHGNTYNKEIECKRCHALLSYCLSDIKREFYNEEYFGKIHSCSKKWIVCPECRNKIILSFIIDGEETVKC